MNYGQKHRDRKYITTRVFIEKFRILYDLVLDKNMFVSLKAKVATTEFQNEVFQKPRQNYEWILK